MGTRKARLMFGVAAIAVALTAGMPHISAQNMAVEEFTAFAININSRPRGGSAATRPTTARLTIRIERWSTDEQRNALLAIVREEQNVQRANQALLRELQRMPRVGSIRDDTSVGWDLRFAQQATLDEGGRQIVIGTDRPIDFWEAVNQPRTIDYPFTILEMRLDKNNEGEGKMLADTRILVNQRTNAIELEHYDIAPVRLNQIRRRN